MKLLFYLTLLCGAGLLYGQNYQLVLTDQVGEPLFGVLAISPVQQLLGESNLSGELEFPNAFSERDSFRLQFIGYTTIENTPQGLNMTKGEPFFLPLQPSNFQLTTIGVVGRRNEMAKDIPYQVQLISNQEIATLQSNNSADALADLSGVYVQKSQFGGGSPVVRGFEANRVLLVVDGVRMNNAIYRSGHLQNAITVDVNSLDRMELIYGPGSLAYGSDALGGVIHFRTRTPKFKVGKDRWKVRLQSSIASAASSKRFGAQLEYGTKNFASYSQLSYGDFGDLRAGNNRPDDYAEFGLRPFYLQRINGRDSLITNKDSNRQVSSGYRQYDLLQKFRFRLHERVELKANFQFSTSSDIPRYDQLTEVRDGQLRWAEWNYGPQTRILASLRLDDRRGTKLWDVASVILAHQFTAEDRFQRRNGDPLREVSKVEVYGGIFQVDFSKSLTNKSRLNYGIDARHDEVNSSAWLYSIDDFSTPIITAPARYPSNGSSLTNAGVYADYRYQLTPRLEVQLGGRYSHQWLSASFGANDPIEWPQNYLDGITNDEGAFTAAASLNYRYQSHRFRTLFAQGFRAPNIDDFGKFFQRNPFIQVPNPDLSSERSYSFDFGYDFENEDWAFHATTYFSRLNNAIIRTDFQLPDGADFFLSFGDTLRVQANVNADEATIYGFDLDFRRRLGDNFSFRTDFHWLRGIRKEKETGFALPQDHIAPAYGQATLKFQSNKFSTRFRLRYQVAKPIDRYAINAYDLSPSGQLINIDRTGTSDNFDLTPRDPITGELQGAYGWFTLNLNTQYELNEHWTFRAGIENILDTHYRTFASGVSAPGRNVVLGVEWAL